MIFTILISSGSFSAEPIDNWPFEGAWTQNPSKKKKEIDCFPGELTFKSTFKAQTPQKIGGFSGDMVNGELLQVGSLIKGPCSPGNVILAISKSGSKGYEFVGPLSFDGLINFDEFRQPLDCEERPNVDVYIETNKNFIILRDLAWDFKKRTKAVLKLVTKNDVGLTFPDKLKSKDEKLDFKLSCFFPDREPHPSSHLSVATSYGEMRTLDEKPSRNSLYLQNAIGLTAIYSSPQFGIQLPGYIFSGYVNIEPKRLKKSKLSKPEVQLYEFSDEKDPDLELSFKKYSELKAKNKNTAENTENKNGLKTSKPGTALPTKVEFLKFRPFLFHYDPLNRLERYITSTDSIPILAEPVIYIYPKNAMKVSVNIGGPIQVFASAPKLDKGWHVFALPTGIITDNEGNKMRFLFWEGIFQNLPTWTEAWHVSSDEIYDFFNQILPKMGLSKSETDDFVHYWGPILTAVGYYDIRFLPRNYIDAIAPLKTQPKFETIIRIEMEARVAAPTPTLPEPASPVTPIRKGSVLVEWGGVKFLPEYNF